MNRMQEQAKEFHLKYGLPVSSFPRAVGANLALLRVRLHNEEGGELTSALQRMDLEDIADALGDLLYVVFGTACACGINMEPIVDEIHRSNMTKEGYTDGGKIAKGKNYSPPKAFFPQYRNLPLKLDGSDSEYSLGGG